MSGIIPEDGKVTDNSTEAAIDDDVVMNVSTKSREYVSATGRKCIVVNVQKELIRILPAMQNVRMFARNARKLRFPNSSLAPNSQTEHLVASCYSRAYLVTEKAAKQTSVQILENSPASAADPQTYRVRSP